VFEAAERKRQRTILTPGQEDRIMWITLLKILEHKQGGSQLQNAWPFRLFSGSSLSLTPAVNAKPVATRLP
jgi:hypothetical protein